MDKLTELIKEAKPLYKIRKRNKFIAKTLFILISPIVLFTGVFQVYQTGNELYASLDNNNLQYELLNDELGLLR